MGADMSQEQRSTGTETVERLDLRSADVAAARREELLKLFPEAAGEAGTIDLDQLRRALGDAVEPGKERYGMTWPGKADCFRTIQTPSTATLLPVPEESVDFDTTKNIVIEGDNLEVLKLLQKSYLSQVKMIYIDPPYNTGNDFIYPDNFAESLQTYLAYTGQVDAEGRKFSTNPDTSGRFHSNWLNMMFPRLYLARNLLREDGCIFISIDDGESANLRRVCDEVFGEENFAANIVWQKKYSVSNDDPGIAPMHDHILVYQKSDDFDRNLLPRTEKQNDRYTNPDNDPRGPWTSGEYVSSKSRAQRPTLWYPIRHPRTGQEVWPEENAVWRYSREKHEQVEREGRLYWGPDQSYKRPRLKRYLSEIQDGIVPSTWWPFQDVGHNDEAQKETAELIGPKVFTTPKPIRLLKRMLEIGCSKDGLVLDFFAGSGATGQAVLQMNAADGGSRRYIMVQLPEPTGIPEFRTVADITKARMRRFKARADKSAESTLALRTPRVDDGFRAYRLAESNFQVWDAARANNEQVLLEQLQAHIEHIRSGRSEDDLLCEILLKSGFALDARTTKLELAGASAWSIQDGALIVSLERNATLDQVRAIADAKPERVVMLDAAFAANDQLKANAAQIFKSKNIAFKTV